MSSVTLYPPQAPTVETGSGGRLYAAFLAGRSPHGPMEPIWTRLPAIWASLALVPHCPC